MKFTVELYLMAKKHISIMNFEDQDRFIFLDSISKEYNTCGARIGVLGTKNKCFFRRSDEICSIKIMSSFN